MARKQSIQLCPVAWRPRVTRSGPSAAKAAVNRLCVEDSSRPSLCCRVTQACTASRRPRQRELRRLPRVSGWRQRRQSEGEHGGLLRAALKLQYEECEAVAFRVARADRQVGARTAPPPHIEGPLSLAGDLTAVTRRLSCRTANRAWTGRTEGPNEKGAPDCDRKASAVWLGSENAPQIPEDLAQLTLHISLRK